MKLLRLRLRGLRSFTRETEIDLARLGEQGLFAISGPTGAGKSTILDGIFLAFFGRCPRGEPGECVSAGALELSVRLELLEGRGAEAREVAVERRFRWSRKKSGSEGGAPGEVRGAPRHLPLRIEERSGEGWAAADLGGRKAEDYLAERIVRVTMSDFQQAVVLPQGEFDALLRARPAERRTLVASLFRTEHLGAPLIEVLRGRETTLRSEIGKLEEAEREVAVSDDDARAAEELRATTQADAAARERDLAAADQRATALRLARQRCVARDAAAAALARVEKDLEARAPDRARVTRGRRAAGAQGAVDELTRAAAFEAEARARTTRADADARAAEVRKKAAEAVLEEATAARAAELPRALEQLGRARQALERGRDLPALDAAGAAREKELSLAEAGKRDAALAHTRAAARLAAAEDEEREGATRLEAARVGEDERAAAVAVAALTELALAEERLAEVTASELGLAEARVASLAASLAAGEVTAREALAETERRSGEVRRLEVEAQRAADEVDASEQALTAARHDAAAADLAASLVPGKPCPVCGAKRHPGGVRRGAATAIEAAEHRLTAARSLARAADRERAEGSRAAVAGDEDARATAAHVETLAADLAAAREAARRQAAGEEEPRAVGEARAAVARLGARADLSLSALALERRAEVREAARREPAGAAEARIAALGRRAREAEALEQALATARARAAQARADAGAKLEAVDRAERARATAEGRASEAAAAARARREELAALLADLTSRGQGALFERGTKPRTAEAWVTLLEARTVDLAQREEKARAALEAVRGDVERLSLEARGASVASREAGSALARAQAAVDKAIAEAGFESLPALREALLDPAVLAELDSALRRLDAERERLAFVLAERRRDVDVEVSEDEARAAEAARDDARRDEGAARARAAEAAARGEEIARRRARALELRVKIAALEPRAERLGRIRQVVMSNQLSELAAERHLEAVTRGAAALLKALSSDRYALVRDAAGAFAVSDAAHGGMVRPPSTLSGGEAFLVSLSLALSLSERIQLAGRTRFDFFFLDEGFGSLDLATLEVALGALEQLRGPNRLIGMISHVPAIEDRMPRRLAVSTERRGGATVVVHEP